VKVNSEEQRAAQLRKQVEKETETQAGPISTSPSKEAGATRTGPQPG